MMYRLKRFWQLFWSGGEADEPLVEVMRAAAVDPQIKNSLFMILRMDSGQRKTAVQSLVIRLKSQSAPQGLISALAFLEDDDFAAATLKVLEQDL
ncbi:MAG: hypothetical protein ACE37D_03405 [Pseudomonadales bacterium]|jgi:hypothetical protein